MYTVCERHKVVICCLDPIRYKACINFVVCKYVVIMPGKLLSISLLVITLVQLVTGQQGKQSLCVNVAINYIVHLIQFT